MPPIVNLLLVSTKGVAQALAAVTRALWQSAGAFLRAGASFLGTIRPFLVLVGAKVVRWYAKSYLKRGEKIFNWTLWLVGLFTRKGK